MIFFETNGVAVYIAHYGPRGNCKVEYFSNVMEDWFPSTIFTDVRSLSDLRVRLRKQQTRSDESVVIFHDDGVA